jgi:selenocysteine lyase/cysteine desulfurase
MMHPAESLRSLLATVYINGDNTMRALAAATALFLIATPALAASPQVEAAVKVLQAIGSDPARLDRFCKVMKIVEGIQERIERLEARITSSLDQALGEHFKAYREAAKKIEDDEDESADSKALTTALDDLSDKCPN